MRINSLTSFGQNFKTNFRAQKNNLQSTIGILASLNNAKITGTIKGDLKNGDKVELSYADGVLLNSKRTGAKNIIKRFDLVETATKPIIIIEENLDTDKVKITKSRKKDGKIYSRIDNEGNTFHKGTEDNFIWISADKKHLKEWYSNGKPKFESLPNGFQRGWHKNGQIQYVKKNGIIAKQWYENGQLAYERDQFGNSKMWWEDGKKRMVSKADGTKTAWDKNGQLSEEITKDGTRKEWYANGQISLEILPNGTMKEWFEDGTLQRQTFENGDVKIWNEKGELIYHKNPGNGIIW